MKTKKWMEKKWMDNVVLNLESLMKEDSDIPLTDNNSSPPNARLSFLTEQLKSQIKSRKQY